MFFDDSKVDGFPFFRKRFSPNGHFLILNGEAEHHLSQQFSINLKRKIIFPQP